MKKKLMAILNDPGFYQALGYYSVHYMIVLGITTIFHFTLRPFIIPIAALVFPINENTSLVKELLVISGFYWTSVIIAYIMARRKQSS